MPYTINKYKPKRRTGTVVKRSRRTRVSRGVRSAPMTGFNFRRSYSIAVTTSSGFHYGATAFALNTLPNFAEFTSLFDQYRIKKVQMNFVWRSSGMSQIETGIHNLAGMPIMYSVIDNDDATVPTNIQEIQQYQNHRTTYFSSVKRVKRLSLAPRTLNTIYRTGATSAYALGKRNQWLDMSATDIPHYGLKWAIDVPQSGGAAVEATFDIIYTIFVQMRGPR